MSNDEDIEEYECQAAGHTGSRSFYEPAGWSPKWCPDECRPWKNAQVDQEYTCQSCGLRFCITATTKIYHYFNEGPWEDPTECAKCARGERPVRNTGVFKRRVLPVRILTDDFNDDLPVHHSPTVYLVNTNPADYQHVVNRSGETRQVHVERHAEDSPHAWTDPAVAAAAGERTKSPTSLASKDYTFDGLLRSANIVGHATLPERVREYITNDKLQRIVKVTLTDTNRLEATFIERTPGPNGHELVTTRDNLTVQDVIAKLNPNPTNNRPPDWV